MKTILLIFILLPFTKIFAQANLNLNLGISIRPAKEKYCELSLPSALNITEIGQHQLEAGFIYNRLNKWIHHLKIAGDPVINKNNSVLCYGFYQDAKGPNAIAYSNAAILFDKRLLSAIPQLSQASYWDSINFILAHEFAHFLQNTNQLQFDYTLPMLSTKIKELHADCVAGYLLQIHNEMNFNDSNNKIESLIKSLGAPHAIGTHGMAEDRLLATAYGIGSAVLEQNVGFYANTITSDKILRTCALRWAPTNLQKNKQVQ